MLSSVQRWQLIETHIGDIRCLCAFHAARYATAQQRPRVDELLSDVTLELYRILEQYDATRGTPEALLFGSLQYVIPDMLRRNHNGMLARPDTQQAGAESFADYHSKTEHNGHEITSIIQEAVDSLSPRKRLVVTRWMQGYSLRDTAQELGLSLAATWQEWHGALRALRLMLEGKYRG